MFLRPAITSYGICWPSCLQKPETLAFGEALPAASYSAVWSSIMTFLHNQMASLATTDTHCFFTADVTIFSQFACGMLTLGCCWSSCLGVITLAESSSPIISTECSGLESRTQIGTKLVGLLNSFLKRVGPTSNPTPQAPPPKTNSSSPNFSLPDPVWGLATRMKPSSKSRPWSTLAWLQVAPRTFLIILIKFVQER